MIIVAPQADFRFQDHYFKCVSKLYSPLRASEITIVMAYFVYPNGTALTDSQVTIMLSDLEYHPILAQLGLKNIVSTACHVILSRCHESSITCHLYLQVTKS